ncbi:Nuclear pore complex protein Nup93 [Frankliniella fusca]|uniref:Nuclear pore protein n=1 Tax=Frankliniella fusca TaxID=407009 RepID=A0AAE1GTU5_9NEOP|nr:Nuclear pore complex protein Nup93 [Frankliniella fusca]
MGDSDFSELLTQAEQLANDIDGVGELPRVERSLRQVLDASNDLWSKVTLHEAPDIQAHMMLASKGVDLTQLSQKLDTLSTRKTFEPLEPVPEADISSYLKNEVENVLLSLIEGTHRRSSAAADQRLWDSIRQNWSKEMRQMFNALHGSSRPLDLQGLPETSTVADVAPVHSRLDHMEVAYAKEVIDYNDRVIQGAVRPQLVNKFAKAAESFNNMRVNELWEIVQYMSRIAPQFKDNPILTRTSAPTQSQLILQARKYLEERYKKYMTKLVEGNLALACRGGVPGTLSLVRSFVDLRVLGSLQGMLGLEDGQVDKKPIWPQLYYCLRCGDIDAALSCATQAGAQLNDLCAILGALKSSPERALDPSMESTVRFQYRCNIRKSPDPFKRAVYCILGACDVSDEHSEVAKTADDYLWFKLCQIREGERTDSRSGENITLQHLQTLISQDYGEAHYNALEQPHVYFQMLFLTGQYELALEFLWRIDKLKVHAVHMAIALHESNLLGIPNCPESPLLCVDPSDQTPHRRLNLARLIQYYVRRFNLTDMKEALHYYYFLRGMRLPSGDNLFRSCISNLAMESRDFSTILGRLESDGCRTPGIIDIFNGVQAEPSEIIEMVASNLEKKGLFEDALEVFDLAGNHEKVMSLMSGLLSQVVHLTSQQGSLRFRLAAKATDVSRRIEGNKFRCSDETYRTFQTLRHLLEFFDKYHAGDYVKALELIVESGLIPSKTEEVENRVNNFRKLGDEICHNFPQILLATMTILHSLYNRARGNVNMSLSSSRLETSMNDKPLASYREQARAITSFAGTMPYRLPGDTNAKLVQMEILMH